MPETPGAKYLCQARIARTRAESCAREADAALFLFQDLINLSILV
ncbi:hypothetical protein [Tumebacillus flagellatus]|nr:hypothetical protein [Tumebacillus flagellatus]